MRKNKKEKEYIEKTEEIAKLYFLMAENNLKLGITYDCWELIEKAKSKLKASFHI